MTTSSTIPDNLPPNALDVTLAEPGPAQVLYAATLELPDFPTGTYHCPVDFGFRQTISFTRDQGSAVTAILNTGGCRAATISGVPAVRQTTGSYWGLLAQELGVDESTLLETPPQ